MAFSSFPECAETSRISPKDLPPHTHVQYDFSYKSLSDVQTLYLTILGGEGNSREPQAIQSPTAEERVPASHPSPPTHLLKHGFSRYRVYKGHKALGC